MTAIFAWFMGTSVGKSLRWMAGGALVVVGLIVAYLRWRSAQREIGADQAKDEQRKNDQGVVDNAHEIEDRVRRAGAESARDGLRDYANKRKN